jgi:flagellar basal-body rod modification protein FlgD
MIIPALSPASTADTTNPAASTTSSTDATDTSGTNALLEPNEFLDLLVDSLKYQDPLDPTSSADFLTQLASLSQVQTEQQVSQTDETSAAANLMGDTIVGSDSSGLPVTGIVSGFAITSTGPTLDVGAESVALGEITSVANPSSSTSNS